MLSIITKKKQENKTAKDLAIEIIDIFEEKLEELNVSLPDKCREANDDSKKDEARIYGSNYYDLEDRIENFLSINKKYLKDET